MDEIRVDGEQEKGSGRKRRPAVSGESAKVEQMEAYKERNRLRKKRRMMAGGIAAALVLAAGIAVALAVRYRSFDSYEVLESSVQEDTLTYSFLSAGENIFRFGIDSAQLRNREDQVLWSDAYVMRDPQAVVCDTAVAVYDKAGTSIVIYNTQGRCGEVSTNMPIVKASVASQGVVAAILENGEDTWIKYYDSNGEEIASFRTMMNSPGYPLDISLSADGMMMAVSYVYAEAGEMKTQIAFYHFGSAGQNLVDNLVNAESYSNLLCPDVKFVNENTCIGFFEDGFRVYEGSKKPVQTAKVEEEKEILSCASNHSAVALVVRGEDSDHPYVLKVYTLQGKELFTEQLAFTYDSLQMDEKQIILLNRQEMCVYSLNGVERFNGPLGESQINNVIGIGRDRYLAVTEGGVNIIKLK